MSEMYKRIEDLCKQKGISVTFMCKEADIKRSCLSELSSGRTKQLSSENLSKIAFYFGISTDELLGRETNQSENDEINAYLEELRNRPEMRMLFSVSTKATKEEIEQAVKIIEALRKNE